MVEDHRLAVARELLGALFHVETEAGAFSLRLPSSDAEIAAFSRALDHYIARSTQGLVR